MITVIVVLVIVVVIAGLLLSQPRIRERTPFGRRQGGVVRRRPGSEPDEDRPSGRGERRLIAEGEAIRERVEEDLRRTPPSVRARTIPRQKLPDPAASAVDPYAASNNGSGALSPDDELAERARRRRLREERRRRTEDDQLDR